MGMKLSHRLLAWMITLVVLLGVFALYLQPHFLFTLAQQVWSCF
jgi:Tfp pilus assembly protein PilW